MRVKVSKELEKYSPLTIWQIIKLICGQLIPWALLVLTLIVGLLLSRDVDLRSINAKLSPISACLLFFMFLLLFGVKKSASAVIKDYWQRNVDRYVAIFVRDTNGEMRFRNAIVWSALDSELKTIQDQEGFYAVLPLFVGIAGWMHIGRRDAKGKREFCRSLWGVHPVYLDADDHPGRTTVTVNNYDDLDDDSMTLPLYVVASLLLAAPIRNDAASSISMTISGMVLRCEKFADELSDCRGKLAGSESQFHHALNTLFTVYTELEASKRFIKSKEGQRIREDVESALLELLPPDDPRRRKSPEDVPVAAS